MRSAKGNRKDLRSGGELCAAGPVLFDQAIRSVS
jgi:hypothetical protein